MVSRAWFERVYRECDASPQVAFLSLLGAPWGFVRSGGRHLGFVIRHCFRNLIRYLRRHSMKITDLRIHPIAIADPPLRSSYGLHAPYALRTIIELESDAGVVGIAETYGGDAQTH